MEAREKCAGVVCQNKENIISLWEETIRHELIGAGKSSSIMLRNHMGALLDIIADMVEECGGRKLSTLFDQNMEAMNQTRLHGMERAQMEGYTLDQVMQEYFILNRILVKLLKENQVLTDEIAEQLRSVFEIMIRKSCTAFIEFVGATQDKLIGTLAHDLRNPLMVALSTSEILQRMPEKREILTQIMQKNLQRAIKITEGLMDTISLKAGEGIMLNFERADYVRLAKEVCEDHGNGAGPQVVYLGSDEPIWGCMDVVAIKRMIDNLVENAIKYGDRTSPIVVAVGAEDETATFSVRNMGKPIPEEKQKDMFNFLNHNEDDDSKTQKSWGMGLTIVKIIVDAHHGTIRVKSGLEEGTVFKVSLQRSLRYAGKVRIKLEELMFPLPAV